VGRKGNLSSLWVGGAEGSVPCGSGITANASDLGRQGVLFGKEPVCTTGGKNGKVAGFLAVASQPPKRHVFPCDPQFLGVRCEWNRDVRCDE
jgi:hypothetical protein